MNMVQQATDRQTSSLPIDGSYATAWHRPPLKQRVQIKVRQKSRSMFCKGIRLALDLRKRTYLEAPMDLTIWVHD